MGQSQQRRHALLVCMSSQDFPETIKINLNKTAHDKKPLVYLFYRHLARMSDVSGRSKMGSSNIWKVVLGFRGTCGPRGTGEKHVTQAQYGVTLAVCPVKPRTTTCKATTSPGRPFPHYRTLAPPPFTPAHTLPPHYHCCQLFSLLRFPPFPACFPAPPAPSPPSLCTLTLCIDLPPIHGLYTLYGDRDHPNE